MWHRRAREERAERVASSPYLLEAETATWPETAVVSAPAPTREIAAEGPSVLAKGFEALTGRGIDEEDEVSVDLLALKDEANNVEKLSFAERSDRSIKALANRANAKRIAVQKKEAASRAMGWLNWDEALDLISEAGELDPESLEIAEEDAVITRLAMQAMDPNHQTHRVGFGRYNRFLLELDLRGCTVDVNQLNRLLAWRTMHAQRYLLRAIKSDHIYLFLEQCDRIFQKPVKDNIKWS